MLVGSKWFHWIDEKSMCTNSSNRYIITGTITLLVTIVINENLQLCACNEKTEITLLFKMRNDVQ
jgi:hypothetical protein